jgi:hypothetical protein
VSPTGHVTSFLTLPAAAKATGLWVSPNGGWLFVTTQGNQIMRFGLASGSGNSDGGSGSAAVTKTPIPVDNTIMDSYGNYGFTLAGGTRYRGAVFDGTHIWYVPQSEPRIARLDRDTGVFETHTPIVPGFYSSGQCDGQHIWMVPYETSTQLLKIDKDTAVMIAVPFTAGGHSYTDFDFYSSSFDGAHLWLIPMNAQGVVKVRVGDHAMTYYSTWPLGFVVSAALNFGSAVWDGSRHWMLPLAAAAVVAIYGNGTMVKYDTWPIGMSLGTQAFIGGCFDGTSVWMAPARADRVVRIDVSSGVMTGILPWPGGYTHLTATTHAFTGAIFDGAAVWLLPRLADGLIRVDVATDAMTHFTNWPANHVKPNGDAPGSFTCHGGVFDGQKIWLTPENHDRVITFGPRSSGTGTQTLSATPRSRTAQGSGTVSPPPTRTGTVTHTGTVTQSLASTTATPTTTATPAIATTTPGTVTQPLATAMAAPTTTAPAMATITAAIRTATSTPSLGLKLPTPTPSLPFATKTQVAPPSVATPPVEVSASLVAVEGEPKKRRGVATVLGSVVDPTAAEALSVTAVAATMLSGGVSPTSANKAVNVARIAATLNCELDDDALATSALAVFIVFPIGGTKFRYLIGGAVMVFVLVLACAAASMLLNHLAPTCHTVRRAQAKVWHAIISYTLPTAVGYITTIFVHADAAGDIAFAVIAGIAALAMYGAALYVVARHLPTGKETKFDAPEEQAGDKRLYAVYMFADGCTDARRQILRVFFFEDVIASSLMAVVAGVMPEGEQCTLMAVLMLVIAAAHAAYVTFLRPYDDNVENGFAIVIGFGQIALASAVVWGTSDRESDAARGTVGGVTLFLFVVLFLQTVVLLAMWLYEQRVKLKCASEEDPVEADAGRNGVLVVPLLDDATVLDIAPSPDVAVPVAAAVPDPFAAAVPDPFAAAVPDPFAAAVPDPVAAAVPAPVAAAGPDRSSTEDMNARAPRHLNAENMAWLDELLPVTVPVVQDTPPPVRQKSPELASDPYTARTFADKDSILLNVVLRDGDRVESGGNLEDLL